MTRASTRCVACGKRMQVSVRLAPRAHCMRCLYGDQSELRKSATIAARHVATKRARQGAGK